MKLRILVASLVVGLTLFFFQNCGTGFQSSESKNTLASASSPAPSPSQGPGPSPNPAPGPGPAPMPAPMPAIQNLWAPLTTTATPTQRWGAATTWTGTQMFVWSGWSGVLNEPFPSDGGLLNPTTMAWSPISATSAHPATNGARASLLNGKVVVWGGLTYTTGSTNLGSLYDPVTNIWNTLPQTNTPEHRSFHAQTSFANNSKLFVWGGYYTGGPSGVFQRGDGAVYDSTTLTWTPVSTVGAPAARQWVEATWTGSKILIFGGCLPYTNDIYSYDPATNSWATLSNVGAPSPRCGHSQVWTGNKLVVFGGNNLETEYNDGGVYDPATNTWSPLPVLAGAPMARSVHSAVWTGTEMLVWGGYLGNARNGTNTGGKFK